MFEVNDDKKTNLFCNQPITEFSLISQSSAIKTGECKPCLEGFFKKWIQTLFQLYNM